jgi:hypothetical protein
VLYPGDLQQIPLARRRCRSHTIHNTGFGYIHGALVHELAHGAQPHRARERDGFRDERGKIGDDTVKGKLGGHFVYSEIIELKHIATGRRFLVSYQNARQAERATVSKLVFDGLTSYVKATP